MSEPTSDNNRRNDRGEGSRGGYQGNRDNARPQRDGESRGYQGNRDGQRTGGYQGNRDNARPQRDGDSRGYQGNRDGQRTGGYQGNRDGQRTGGYQGNRDGAPRTGGYQGNRDGAPRTGGYQGNRDNARPQRDGDSRGYQGNREGQRTGGYQGNRDGAPRTGGYQGNRDGAPRTGGYLGNRDGAPRTGGYQSNRDGAPRTGGYQGNRDNARPQRDGESRGYQGNRDGQRTGGYQGNRDGAPRTGGYQGNRDGAPRTGGYQGNRDNARPQRDGDSRGYQGNRDGAPRTGGYQGNRDGAPHTGGYQGNRDGAPRTGGYQGNRDNARPQRDGDSRGYQGNRDGARPERSYRGGAGRTNPEQKLWTNAGAPARGDYRARDNARELTEQEMFDKSLKAVRVRHEDPEIPEYITEKDLDKVARNELKTLTKENAEWVARHMVMAAGLIEEDPELAHAHATSAARRAGRIGVVRETLAITAYASGDYNLALRELRTYRRITGSNEQLPLMVDSERAVGRPERALELGRSIDAQSLSTASRVALAIAMSGARLDQEQTELALAELQIPELDPNRAYEWSPALYDAYAEVLGDLGRDEEAAAWRKRANIAESAIREKLGIDAAETIEILSIQEDYTMIAEEEAEAARQIAAEAAAAARAAGDVAGAAADAEDIDEADIVAADAEIDAADAVAAEPATAEPATAEPIEDADSPEAIAAELAELEAEIESGPEESTTDGTELSEEEADDESAQR